MSLPDRIWVPAVAALVLAVGFVGALLVRVDGDASMLVHAAPPWTSEADAPASLTVQPDPDDGFDGQFFYRIGVAPWSTAETEAGVTFDLPALRNARWGYGALAWAASAGDQDLVPWSLIAVNLAGAAALGAVGGGFARADGRHAAWGVLLVLWPGFAYSLSLDTSELVASALAFGGLLATQNRRWLLAGGLLSLAAITRDTTVVIPFAVALAGLWTWRRDPGVGRCQVAVGSSALVAFGGWQLLQRARFGALPLTSSGDNNLSSPFGGLVDQLGDLLPPAGSAEALRLVSMAGLLALVAVAAVLLARHRQDPIDPTKIAWFGAVGVVVVLNAYLWSGATAFMRASTEAAVLSILLILRHAPPRLLAAVGVGLSSVWLITAAAQLSKLA